MRTVESASRSGGWDYSSGYRRRAVRALEMAKEASVRYAPIRDAFFSIANRDDRNRDALFAAYDECRIYADSTVLFSALAPEGALNLYGVVRLGEKFYQSHYERLGLVAKVSALLASSMGKLAEKSDPIVDAAMRISTLRNGLAHPKAREIESFTELADRNVFLKDAEDAVKEMDRFFVELVALDPQAEWIATGA